VTSPALPVTAADVQAAAGRIAGGVVRTPLLPAPGSTEDSPAWLKPEMLQPIGSFKLRGATNAAALLDPARRRRGLVTHSSGNHAQAVAWVARAFGVPAVVVMPDTAPDVKVAATRALGADVVLVPVAERARAAEQLAAERGLALLAPFDDPHVVAGQGTVGLEIAEDLPDVGTVLVPVSGGGLLAGVAVAVTARCPDARVVGVEPELAADLAEGFRLGRRVAWDTALTSRTVADALRVGQVGQVPWAVIERLVTDVVTVPDDAMLDAVRELAVRARLVAEPGGAAAWAALRSGAVDPRGRATVAVLSGGSVDPALLARLLARPEPASLPAAGRAAP
jgi:threonine dehydratase